MPAPFGRACVSAGTRDPCYPWPCPHPLAVHASAPARVTFGRAHVSSGHHACLVSVSLCARLFVATRAHVATRTSQQHRPLRVPPVASVHSSVTARTAQTTWRDVSVNVSRRRVTANTLQTRCKHVANKGRARPQPDLPRRQPQNRYQIYGALLAGAEGILFYRLGILQSPVRKPAVA